MRTATILCALFVFDAAAGAGLTKTIYVSKLGDNSDGSSWDKAYTSIQAALQAVPDAQGGYRVLVRPDTYLEANLWPSFKGAQTAYNVLESDYDGSQGSGATGYALIDCSDPEHGQKSLDWWGPFRCSPEHSGVDWDRWRLRHIYTAGGDGGLFWDLPPKIEPFTVVVEDSVGIGRAFGGGAGHFEPRPEEPIVYRRCYLWSQDWWGDAAGAYVRAEHETMPEKPDVTFEDCSLVGPDNALQAGNPGFAGFTRVKLKGCRLVSMNYSQPRGTPGTGIISSTIEGRLLHVDLEDCTLMGYKVFGAGKGDVSYSTKGSVRAYVEFEQPVPEGMTRLGYWPADTFARILPPPPPDRKPALVKGACIARDLCEMTPLLWKGRLCYINCVRPAQGGTRDDYYLALIDAESGAPLAKFAEGYGLGCAIVQDGTLYAFASRYEKNDWNDVTVFWSADLKQWEQRKVIEQEKEHLFNSTVCAAPGGFVMAYETNDPKYPAFSIKFARSKDLKTWAKVPDVVFGADRYTACPCLRYSDGYFYIIYTEHRTPRWFFESYVARSKDLAAWRLSPMNPVITPTGDDEGINTSDVDLIELDGKTQVYYCVGDQHTWANVKRADFAAPMGAFFAAYFPEGP
jgi:hypothetical protein